MVQILRKENRDRYIDINVFDHSSHSRSCKYIFSQENQFRDYISKKHICVYEAIYLKIKLAIFSILFRDTPPYNFLTLILFQHYNICIYILFIFFK